MIYGDVFEFHGQRWVALQDYGDGRVLATPHPLNGGVAEVKLVDVTTERATRQRAAVIENTSGGR